MDKVLGTWILDSLTDEVEFKDINEIIPTLKGLVKNELLKIESIIKPSERYSFNNILKGVG